MLLARYGRGVWEACTYRPILVAGLLAAAQTQEQEAVARGSARQCCQTHRTQWAQPQQTAGWPAVESRTKKHGTDMGTRTGEVTTLLTGHSVVRHSVILHNFLCARKRQGRGPITGTTHNAQRTTHNDVTGHNVQPMQGGFETETAHEPGEDQ